MKSTKIEQSSNDPSVPELSLLPAGDFETPELKDENYDGGFHIQSTAASSNRIISKRSALQEFTCR